MSQEMRNYIAEESAVIRQLLDNREALLAPVLKAFAKKKISEIVLVGSGSSHNVGLIAQPYIEEATQTRVSVFTPSTINSKTRFHEDSLFLFISQGGQSTNTIAAMEAVAAKHRGNLISITENAASNVAGMSDFHLKLPWERPETVGAKTKGVTGSVVMLMLLFASLAQAGNKISQSEYDGLTDGLERFCEGQETNTARTKQWFERNRVELAASDYMLVISQDELTGVGQEIALKLLETIYRPVFAYDFEEDLHGVANSITPRNYFIFLEAGGKNRERIRALQDIIRGEGAKLYAFTDDTEAKGTNELSLLKTGNKYTDALNHLLAGQLLCAFLSEYCGINVNRSRFSGFGSIMKTKAKGDDN